MNQTKNKKLLFLIIGAILFTIGLVTFIISFTIKRPVVKFVNYDGTVLCEAPTAIGKNAEYTGQKPIRESEQNGYIYVFTGWEPSIENIQKDITVTAVYEKRIMNYTLEFRLNNGTVNEELPTKYTVEQEIVLPIPERPNCTFAGWYTTEKFIGTPITKLNKGTTGNKVLYAKWDAPTYNITYELNGGTCNELINTYSVVEKVTLPTPKKDGQIFGGWYTTPTFDEETKISEIKVGTLTGDLNLYAKWLYSINYELNEGYLSKDAVKTYDNAFNLVLPLPQRIGYEFVGWYTTEELTDTPIEEIEAGYSDNIQVFAKWNKIESNVIFEENGFKYIYFGQYVQSVVVSQELIEELDKVVDENNKAEYLGKTYVRFTSSSAVNPTRFNYRVEFKKGEFSDYIQAKTKYYFLVEPIKWRVLESKDGKLTLLSDSILDYRQFDLKSNNYETSAIREWLNGTFLKEAFSEEELAKIVTTEVKNTATSTANSNNPYACGNTQDKVFLLSYEEVTKLEYGFKTAYDVDDPAKKAITSDYVRALGINITTNNSNYGFGSWMLRSPFISENSLSIVNCVKTNNSSMVNCIERFASSTTKYGIRPSIVIEA